jgi:hypothetical protein
MKDMNRIQEELSKVKEVYHEFGLNVHDVPQEIQNKINAMAKAIVKLRRKKK